MDNKPIVIGCDMASGTDSIVSIAAKALANGGIKVISYEMLQEAVRYGSAVSSIEFMGDPAQLKPRIRFIDRFTIYKSKYLHKPRKPLPSYRQIEMRKRKY